MGLLGVRTASEYPHCTCCERNGTEPTVTPTANYALGRQTILRLLAGGRLQGGAGIGPGGRDPVQLTGQIVHAVLAVRSVLGGLGTVVTDHPPTAPPAWVVYVATSFTRRCWSVSAFRPGLDNTVAASAYLSRIGIGGNPLLAALAQIVSGSRAGEAPVDRGDHPAQLPVPHPVTNFRTARLCRLRSPASTTPAPACLLGVGKPHDLGQVRTSLVQQLRHRGEHRLIRCCRPRPAGPSPDGPDHRASALTRR